jgi:hypothetical protein
MHGEEIAPCKDMHGHAYPCKDMHSVEISMQRHAKTHIKYHGKIPWVHKKLKVNPTMT